MRLAIFLSTALFAPLFAAFCACGGGEKPTDHPQTAGSSSASGTSPTTSDGGPSSTTTILMSDAGELQGTKLTQTGTGTMTVEAGAPLDPNKHDPGRSREDLITIIRSHRDEARACYDDFLKTHPRAEGNIDITWKLDPKGKVTETGIEDSKSDMHDPALVKCLGDVIRKIPWAASPRGVETRAHYPFNFHPRGTSNQTP